MRGGWGRQWRSPRQWADYLEWRKRQRKEDKWKSYPDWYKAEFAKAQKLEEHDLACLGRDVRLGRLPPDARLPGRGRAVRAPGRGSARRPDAAPARLPGPAASLQPVRPPGDVGSLRILRRRPADRHAVGGKTLRRGDDPPRRASVPAGNRLARPRRPGRLTPAVRGASLRHGFAGSGSLAHRRTLETCTTPILPQAARYHS
jgi:hypothetical protein